MIDIARSVVKTRHCKLHHVAQYAHNYNGRVAHPAPYISLIHGERISARIYICHIIIDTSRFQNIAHARYGYALGRVVGEN